MKTKYVPGEMPMFFGTYSRNFEYARENRMKSTPAEEQLWTELKNKKLKGLKFRRQHPVGIFILDFYCHSAKLAIELDGGYHLSVEQKEYDMLVKRGNHGSYSRADRDFTTPGQHLLRWAAASGRLSTVDEALKSDRYRGHPRPHKRNRT